MEKLFKEIGLSGAEAKVYNVLLKNKPLTVSAISKLSEESRTNTYAVLSSLESIGLARKDESQPVLRFAASNPANLQTIANEKRKSATQADENIREALPTLLQTFYSSSERPGIRQFEGKEGITQMYEDVLESCEDVLVLRSPYDTDVVPGAFYRKFKQAKHNLGIKTHMISANENTTEEDRLLDKQASITRTILPPGVYEEPVEISVYGDKVATISFGSETIGTIIYSPLIANAMRQIINQLTAKNDNR